MKEVKSLGVYFHDQRVGTLALHKGQLAAFQYDRAWLAEGFSISPFSLPLEDCVFIPKADPLEGLFGVFADSLPDGWGRLLTDRLLTKNQINPHAIGNLNRLAIVGETGMGALTYRPDFHFTETDEAWTYDKLAEECRRILNEEDAENLDELFLLGGSSGGARPKILTKVDGEDWIIKFHARDDAGDIGIQEYKYSLCAKECGLRMEKTRLFPSDRCSGYFGTRRFDVTHEGGIKRRVHMVTVSGLLETSHRIPNLDYDLLLRLTLFLTQDFSEVEQLYRQMCFNVFAHNRDDHSKNFSYLYLEDQARWVLSPAYDLTYSSSIGGEHATTIGGNGRDPGKRDLVEAAKRIGISERKASVIADQVRECTEAMLREYIK